MPGQPCAGKQVWNVAGGIFCEIYSSSDSPIPLLRKPKSLLFEGQAQNWFSGWESPIYQPGCYLDGQAHADESLPAARLAGLM
jgi:hypothetical protein